MKGCLHDAMLKCETLTENDMAELERFQDFLLDAQLMPRTELYRRHQEYVGLSDAELAALAQRQEW